MAGGMLRSSGKATSRLIQRPCSASWRPASSSIYIFLCSFPDANGMQLGKGGSTKEALQGCNTLQGLALLQYARPDSNRRPLPPEGSALSS